MTPEGIGSRVFSCPFGAWKLLAILRPSRDFKFAHYHWQTNHIPGHPQGCSLVLWFTKKNKVNLRFLRSFSWSLHALLQVSSFPNKNHPLLMLFGNLWLVFVADYFASQPMWVWTVKPFATHRGLPAENASPSFRTQAGHLKMKYVELKYQYDEECSFHDMLQDWSKHPQKRPKPFKRFTLWHDGRRLQQKKCGWPCSRLDA